MIEPNPCQIDPEIIAALYVRHGEELRAFLYGVLRDGHLVQDVMQAAFVKAIEKGHNVQEQSLKSWLFQVAFREALVLRRRRAVHLRATERMALASERIDEPADGIMLRTEITAAVRDAVGALPESQRQIVRLRMYDDMKFADIATRLKLPLGTVLARMQAALKRLRDRMQD